MKRDDTTVCTNLCNNQGIQLTLLYNLDCLYKTEIADCESVRLTEDCVKTRIIPFTVFGSDARNINPESKHISVNSVTVMSNWNANKV